MKIEMGESLMLSWVKHVKCCQIATLNWKCSNCWTVYNQQEIDNLLKKMSEKFSGDVFGKAKNANQIIFQGELDVLGVNIDNNIIQNIYAIDVAFHENGLLYKNNLQKITEKLLRSALILYFVFNIKNGDIIFASPKVNKKDVDMLKNRAKEIETFMQNIGFDFKFHFICNQDFYEQILKPVQRASQTNSDTSELFMRCLQMTSLFKKYNITATSDATDGTNTTIHTTQNTRQADSTTDYNNNLVAFCFSCGHQNLFSHLNQGDALQKAADKLGIKKTTLSNLRDSFDRHNPHSNRKGWDKELNSVQKQILNEYKYNVARAFKEAKDILDIN